MHKVNWKLLLLNLFVPVVLVGGGTALLTMNSMEVYQSLRQPPISPPGWLFPVVWTILFILMGIAAYLVATTPDVDPKTRMRAFCVYGAQLLLNVTWSLTFFNAGNYSLALWILIALLLLIFINAVLFYKINSAAGWLLLPYFLWVCFAGYLNFFIALYN